MDTERQAGDNISQRGQRTQRREMSVAVGRIGAPHGIRGEVVVDVRTDDPEARFVPGSVLSTDPPGPGPLTVAGSRWHGNRLLVRFVESPDRSAAERLRDSLLLVSSADLSPSDEEDEFFDHELIGLPAVTSAGDHAGTVVDVVHPPGQDVLVIAQPGGDEALVPFVAAIVVDVDRTAGIVIDPPSGLLDTGESE